MDLDTPELLQALDEFTQQILSPGDLLSNRLEAAISSDATATSDEVDRADEISQIEGTRIELEFTPEEVTEVIQNMQVQIQSPPPSNATTTTATTSTTIAAEDDDNSSDNDTLPLSEPVFQILSQIFDDYNNPTENSTTMTTNVSNIPSEEKMNFGLKRSKQDDLNNFLESYPYDLPSWDSPGSVESDNCLFPELSF